MVTTISGSREAKEADGGGQRCHSRAWGTGVTAQHGRDGRHSLAQGLHEFTHGTGGEQVGGAEGVGRATARNARHERGGEG